MLALSPHVKVKIEVNVFINFTGNNSDIALPAMVQQYIMPILQTLMIQCCVRLLWNSIKVNSNKNYIHVYNKLPS